MAIKKLWITAGCTVCHLCESTAPDVFTVDDTTSRVKEGAAQFFSTIENDIKDAAAGCPVEIIGYETDDGKEFQPDKSLEVISELKI